VSVEYAYSGPLPPPEVLRKFEDVLPGSAERIFSQFEQQSAHRRAQENKVISAGVASQQMGSISGLLLGLTGIGGGIWLTHDDHSVGGLTSLIATITALVATFLYKKDQQGKELARKQEPNKELSNE
jgi:uncharacterized membrane protein